MARDEDVHDERKFNKNLLYSLQSAYNAKSEHALKRPIDLLVKLFREVTNILCNLKIYLFIEPDKSQ